MTINERIKYVIKDFGLNINSFSKAIGLSNNVTIGNIVGGRGGQPSLKVIELILQKYDSINSEWLLTGNGSIYKTNGAISCDKMVTQNGNLDGNLDEKTHKTNGAILCEPEQEYNNLLQQQRSITEQYKELLIYQKEKDTQQQAEIQRLRAEIDRLHAELDKLQSEPCKECSEKRKVG